MQKPAAVLFDLDGTLADTAPDFYDVVNSLRKDDNLSLLSDDTIRQQVSNGGLALARLTWNTSNDDPELENLRLRLLDRYEQLIGSRSRIYPGFAPILAELAQQNIPWSVVTNKPRFYTELLLPRIGIDCPVVICPEDVEQRKPAPDALFKAAGLLNVNADECWYVGDHIRDIKAAQAAGMLSIAATYGYIETTDDPLTWQADCYINSPQQLLQMLKN